MHRQVNAIAGRLSLRTPQREALEILDRITTIVPPRKDTDIATALNVIRSEFPSVTDFEREFPSLCFALATGVGKTRLMGAFISYLYAVYGVRNFFVLAPNLTIYNKLIADFTPNTPKYVFKGIAEFATSPPALITGENYATMARPSLDGFVNCTVNVFNISKINSEVRGGKAPRIKRLSEYIGQSYFDYLAGLPDLVVLMDESHRYRASAGVRAINELKPVLGLELTATPYVESGKDTTPFRNVIYDYPLGRAIADGFVKDPAVVTRKDFSPDGMSAPEIERMKLEDGVRLHESVKVELHTYAASNGHTPVKPFLLVIARDTTHAAELMEWMKSPAFFEGRYADRLLQVDSSQKSAAAEDEMVERLLRVESADEPTEIVVHVNMLKEGWDVTNLYTIVPLRAANARTLVEQSIGRGLRLPYGQRTGVAAVDRLNIVAHDRFQDIVDETSRPDSLIHLQHLVLDPADLAKPTMTVIAPTRLDRMIDGGEAPAFVGGVTVPPPPNPLATPGAQAVAKLVREAVRTVARQPERVTGVTDLTKPEITAEIVSYVEQRLTPPQMALEGLGTASNVAEAVVNTVVQIVKETIDIPRIIVQPVEESRAGFSSFTLDLHSVRYAPPSEDLVVQSLQSLERQTIGVGRGVAVERRPEDYVVRALMNCDDISYEDQADLLYELAGQVVAHLQSFLSEEESLRVLQVHGTQIADLVHTQMLEHATEEAVAYEARVAQGFTQIAGTAFTTGIAGAVNYFKEAPEDKSNMARYVFGGFERCLQERVKFQSDPERRLAVILDRESLRWLRPAKSQFQILYKLGVERPMYQPDFVAETDTEIAILEAKAADKMDDEEVLAKRDAAVVWCREATKYATANGRKPYCYVLIPHTAITNNMSLAGLIAGFTQREST